MILVKDTVIRAIINGIYIKVTFNDIGELIDFKELKTDYLKNVTIDEIKEIVGPYKADTYGDYKALLTIKRHDLLHVFDIYNDSYERLVANAIKSSEYRKFISFIIAGNINSDIDKFDEYYECNLCKYFTKFYKIPKIKLRNNISEDDLKNIIDSWTEKYFIDYLLINGHEKYSYYDLMETIYAHEDNIIWKAANNRWTPYLNIEGFLTRLQLEEITVTVNENLDPNVLLFLNSKLIANNVLNTVSNSAKKNNLPENICKGCE